MTVTKDDLLRIHRGTTSADPFKGREDLFEWMRSIRIDPDEWKEFVIFFATTANTEARLAGFSESNTNFLAAIFSAGFEMGVRYAQQMEIVI